MSENNEEKFRRLAEKRVNNVIKTLRLIGNLSNRSNYVYTDADVEKIFAAINSELKACKAKFSKKGSEGRKFKFD